MTSPEVGYFSHTLAQAHGDAHTSLIRDPSPHHARKGS
jgi:hypothetical protein